jgi:hypothetical protein
MLIPRGFALSRGSDVFDTLHIVPCYLADGFHADLAPSNACIEGISSRLCRSARQLSA